MRLGAEGRVSWVLQAESYCNCFGLELSSFGPGVALGSTRRFVGLHSRVDR